MNDDFDLIEATDSKRFSVDKDDFEEIEGFEQFGTDDNDYVEVQGFKDTKDFLTCYYDTLGKDVNLALKCFAEDIEMILVDGYHRYAATTLKDVEHMVMSFSSKYLKMHSMQKIDGMISAIGFVVNPANNHESRLFVDSLELLVVEGNFKISKSIFCFMDNIEGLPVVTIEGKPVMIDDWYGQAQIVSTAHWTQFESLGESIFEHM